MISNVLSEAIEQIKRYRLEFDSLRIGRKWSAAVTAKGIRI
jgi:hypothetical protein